MVEVRESIATVVVVGNLNPLIFQPDWLRANKIIGEAEAEAAMSGGLEFMLPEAVSINLTSMRLMVESMKF
ncbi:MAG TPA: hypothetical protein VGL66_19900 [Caulobacteraceae bacterium]|jgi:hypothetical protein